MSDPVPAAPSAPHASVAPRSAPAPQIESMLAALAGLRQGPVVLPDPVPFTGSPAPAPAPSGSPYGAPATESELFDKFRRDMRLAGLTFYDCTDSMLGREYAGPAVNVRDPRQASGQTSLRLVSHALGSGLWRMYPVLEPISL